MVSARYHGQVVFCRDVPGTAERYEQSLGFRRAYESDGDIALRVPVAGDGDASVEVYLHPSADLVPTQLGTFAVDDVDAAVAELVPYGWQLTVPPTDQPWGVREAGVTDAEGHTLTLNGPIIRR